MKRWLLALCSATMAWATLVPGASATSRIIIRSGRVYYPKYKYVVPGRTVRSGFYVVPKTYDQPVIIIRPRRYYRYYY